MSEFSVTIRKATVNDSEEIFSILMWFSTSYKPEKEAFGKSLSHLLEDSAVLLIVAEVNEKVVGYCLAFDHYTFHANGRVSWVEEIAVNEEYRMGSVGRLLMEHAEVWARDRDSKLVALASRRAAPFYNAIGYIECAGYFRKKLS